MLPSEPSAGVNWMEFVSVGLTDEPCCATVHIKQVRMKWNNRKKKKKKKKLRCDWIRSCTCSRCTSRFKAKSARNMTCSRAYPSCCMETFPFNNKIFTRLMPYLSTFSTMVLALTWAVCNSITWHVRSRLRFSNLVRRRTCHTKNKYLRGIKGVEIVHVQPWAADVPQ